MTSTRRRRSSDARTGAGAPSDVNSAPARPLRAGRAGTGAAAACRARGWRCSAAWWARLSSDSHRAGPRAATAPWRRSTAAPSAWKSTTGPWPSAAAATRECAGLRDAAGSGAAVGRSEATPAREDLGGEGLHAQRHICPLGTSIHFSPASCPPAPGARPRSPLRQTRPTCSSARSRVPGATDGLGGPPWELKGQRARHLCRSPSIWSRGDWGGQL